MKKLVGVVAALLCAAALAGCSGGTSSKSQGGSAPETQSSAPDNKTTGSPAPGSPSPGGKAADRSAATLVKSGFGQDGPFVWVTSLVHNRSNFVGQRVTVHLELKDASGRRVKSLDQVASFSRVGEDLAMGTQVAVPVKAKIASVNASLSVNPKGAFAGIAFPAMPVSGMKIVRTPYGSWTMRFEVANPLSRPVQGPRVSVICYDKRGTIIGGASAYPPMVPARGKTAVAPAGAIVSGKPARCDAYVGSPF